MMGEVVVRLRGRAMRHDAEAATRALGSRGKRRAGHGVRPRTWWALALVTLAACGSCRSVANSKPAGSAAHPPTSVSAGGTPSRPPTTAAQAAKTGTLAVAPAPSGYEVSTSSDVQNGPVDPAGFDKGAGHVGLANATGFTGGYDETYDSVDTSESIEAHLLQFASESQATAFLPS